MNNDVKIYSLSTGALLLESGTQALLLGGGLPTAQLQTLLSPYRRKLAGIVVPNEHTHRMRGLYDLAVQWELPLIGRWQIILPELVKHTPAIPPQVLSDFDQETFRCGSFSISTFSVRYDSISPCGWKITVNQLTLGIVQDGRLNDNALAALKTCDALVLTNCRNHPADDRSWRIKRLRSVYPTAWEQQTQLCEAGVTLPEYPYQPYLLPAK